ncbi:TPA: hypothetical protein ACTW3X_004635 [Klebsiella pneumoniae]|uniref:hypothetical protein n=1 Tax=Klebsiella pneumoniae TaxID=573 RepID=UPI0006518693|nr:hypothetical protein [Klebsiella pneumoniae]EKU4918048.1 hypothetical protein [Klebsiella pneumoniae]MCG5610281.1 hypothetical protein [Klebsiella pneumoniae]MCH0731100.1 hypothetical protein [Klebsiella pneumoniae]MEA4686426.1 hypothetical protein [Klebsiella pneumoniae]MEA4733011.1 hypothetical protein [Klebsiella pneumoniae]
MALTDSEVGTAMPADKQYKLADDNIVELKLAIYEHLFKPQGGLNTLRLLLFFNSALQPSYVMR